MDSMREILERAEVAAILAEAAADESGCASKYMDADTGSFKGGKGERFQNCVAYMKCKGGVDDPEAVCAKIARAKGAAPGSTQEEMDEALGRGCPPGMKMVFGRCVKVHGSQEQRSWVTKEGGLARVRENPADRKRAIAKRGSAAAKVAARKEFKKRPPRPMMRQGGQQGESMEAVLGAMEGGEGGGTISEAVGANVVARMAEAMLGAPKLEVLMTRVLDDEDQFGMFAGMIQGPLEALIAKALDAAGASVGGGVLSKSSREMRGAARGNLGA